jgi:hypothetical protein
MKAELTKKHSRAWAEVLVDERGHHSARPTDGVVDDQPSGPPGHVPDGVEEDGLAHPSLAVERDGGPWVARAGPPGLVGAVEDVASSGEQRRLHPPAGAEGVVIVCYRCVGH